MPLEITKYLLLITGGRSLEEAESLKKRDASRYQHEYLGIPVGSGGSVFENLELRTITDDEVKGFDRIFQGVDWGWFPDFYAFIRLHYDSNRECCLGSSCDSMENQVFRVKRERLFTKKKRSSTLVWTKMP